MRQIAATHRVVCTAASIFTRRFVAAICHGDGSKRSVASSVSALRVTQSHNLRENVPEDRVKSRKCGTCLKIDFPHLSLRDTPR